MAAQGILQSSKYTLTQGKDRDSALRGEAMESKRGVSQWRGGVFPFPAPHPSPHQRNTMSWS